MELIKSKVESLGEIFCGTMEFAPGFYFVFSKRENLIAPFLLRGFYSGDFYKGKFDFIAGTSLNSLKEIVRYIFVFR